MSTNYVDQLLALQAEEQAIKDKREKLLAAARTEALANAERAVADLNNLGFHYRLVEVTTAGATTTTTKAPSAGRSPRKGGVSEQVLAAVKAAPEGLARAGVIAALNASDPKEVTSISNALANLKKAEKLVAKDGVYTAA